MIFVFEREDIDFFSFLVIHYRRTTIFMVQLYLATCNFSEAVNRWNSLWLPRSAILRLLGLIWTSNGRCFPGWRILTNILTNKRESIDHQSLRNPDTGRLSCGSHLLSRERVSPQWPGPGSLGTGTMSCVYNPPSAIRTHLDMATTDRWEEAVADFLTRFVNHKSHTFVELIKIEIVWVIL